MDIEVMDDVVVEADGQSALAATVERLVAATAMLEQAVERMFGRQGELAVSAEASVGRIVATVESKREAELEQKLAAAEAEIAELRARCICSCCGYTFAGAEDASGFDGEFAGEAGCDGGFDGSRDAGCCAG